MCMSKIGGIAAAVLIVVTPSAFGQTPAQTTPTPKKASDTAATQTFTGCLMTEPAYRTAHNLGKGALGGAGLGDEFVLVDVKVSPAMATTGSAPAPDTSAVTASATASTCADRGVAYRLTGHLEDKLKPLVGHQLEVQGRFQHADDVVAGAAQPADKLPAEVEIISYREAPSPAPTVQPAPPVTSATPPASTPASTIEPARTPSPTPPAPTATEPPRRLPNSASSSPLTALIGVFALGSGMAMMVSRRRFF